MNQQKKVLLVEDDPFIAEIYALPLQQAGFQVIVADDGEKGVQKAKETCPDLIFLDLLLPKLNGLEVLKILKDDPQLKNIPVVIATNLTDEVAAKKSLDMGALDCLVKINIDSSDIVRKAKEILFSNND